MAIAPCAMQRHCNLLIGSSPCPLCRCFHVFKILLEEGVPVVYAREHDSETCAWVGTPSGRGWPIFFDANAIPRFADLRWEPRVALRNFDDIRRRAEHMMTGWKHQLSVCGDAANADPARAPRLRRMERAVRWWTHFLVSHGTHFGEDAGATPSFVVDDGGMLRLDNLMPSAAAAGHAPATPGTHHSQATTPFVARYATQPPADISSAPRPACGGKCRIPP